MKTQTPPPRRRRSPAKRRALLAQLARPAGESPLRVFCSGIGGTGVSGLARLLIGLGHQVSGSDRSLSPRTEALTALGIRIKGEQIAENLTDNPGGAGPFDLFVATAALPPTHPELVAAVTAGVPVVKYAEALGSLVKARRGIAIAGTHGKTTTTSMTATVLRACGREPSWIVGGSPHDLPANAALGAGSELVFEACEFDRSFRNYRPSIAVILNVEEDHLDCYQGGLDEIVEAFVEFGALLNEGGVLIANADCPNTMRVADMVRSVRSDVAIDTFSVEGAGRFTAGDVQIVDGLAEFTLHIDGAPIGPVRLSFPGRHNITNALASIACATRSGVDPAEAAAAISSFHGVGRRFDVQASGDVVVVDDYAHHPTAIRAVLAAARDRYPDRRLVVCFEPHQASRTRELFDDFVDALSVADRVLLSDIYVCRDRQEDVLAVSAADLAAAIRTRSPATEARHVGAVHDLEREATHLLAAGDVALFMGAGKITSAAAGVAAVIGQPTPAPRIAAPATAALERRVATALGDLVQQDVGLGPYCTLKTGGKARFFAAPRNEAEAIEVVRRLRKLGIPVLPLGGGSNVLFGEQIDAAVILTRRMRGARVVGNTVRAVAGAGLQGLLRLAEKNGLGGLETFAGIPGTVGGAIFGNAGGPKDAATVAQLARRVRVLEPDGTVHWRDQGALGLRYRGSELSGCLVLSVDLELTPDRTERLQRVRKEATNRKGRTQPLYARSAGCTFRNPAGGSAGRLIDELGLKGLTVGGAAVSEVHGNFIVNQGGATPTDVLTLMQQVQALVHERTGIELVPELRLIAA